MGFKNNPEAVYRDARAPCSMPDLIDTTINDQVTNANERIDQLINDVPQQISAAEARVNADL